MSDDDQHVMLELEGVSHSYFARRNTIDEGVPMVLDDVSLKVYEGETLGIMGRNGVGKTTMLRLMAAILAPTMGKVTIRPGKTASLLSLGLGFKPDLSGRNNALLAGMLQGSTRARAESFLEEIKEFSELGDSFEQPVKNYSAGMRSRLAFTTALMTHVDILLIDEILSVGDAHFRGKAQEAMKTRVTSDQTVVFVSHMADQMKMICDRIIWLDEGKIVMEGPAEEVASAYSKSMSEARTDGEQRQKEKNNPDEPGGSNGKAGDDDSNDRPGGGKMLGGGNGQNADNDEPQQQPDNPDQQRGSETLH